MLEARNIHKTYRQARDPLHVLKGIDLAIQRGEVLGVVGPSGAGKSTLLHILGGLDHPNQGQVIFAKQDIYQWNEQRRSLFRNQKVGFIFQFYHLLPEFSAEENVILPGLVYQDVKKAEIKNRASQLLERVGLQKRARHKPSELSGGEQQRVAIARALINDPEIVFCDEPTGNLDSENGEQIINLLLEFNQRNQQTLVIVTHDESMAERCHRVIHMRDGVLSEK